MRNTGCYAFEDDGGLWTLFNGGSRRPSSVEEMEGYCREKEAPLRLLPSPNQAKHDFVPMAMAV